MLPVITAKVYSLTCYYVLFILSSSLLSTVTSRCEHEEMLHRCSTEILRGIHVARELTMAL